MKGFDIDNFLNASFKKFTGNKQAVKTETKGNNKPIQAIQLQSTNEPLITNIIDNKIYDKLNIASLNDNSSLEAIIKPLFPNDKVYNNEFTSDKVFILDKFIKTKTKKEKHPQKKNYTKKLIQSLKESKLSYDSVKNMNEHWKNYIKSLMNNAIKPEVIGEKFLKADLHGAIIEIISATNPNTIGIKGLVILETRKTFNILSSDDIIRTILKQGTMFKINLPYNDITINLLGNNFMFKSAERTKIKFKTHYTLNKSTLAPYYP